MSLVFDTSIYFLTMDGNITRRIEGQPHSVPAYLHDRQFDVRPNQDLFTAFSTQDQHGVFLLSGVELVGDGCRSIRLNNRSRGFVPTSFEAAIEQDSLDGLSYVGVVFRDYDFRAS